jgi:hypothetical protein
MQTVETSLGIGSVVRIVRCEVCPVIVGKTATVRHFDTNNDNLVNLSFGRGRPPKGRPELFHVNDIEVISTPGGNDE